MDIKKGEIQEKKLSELLIKAKIAEKKRKTFLKNVREKIEREQTMKLSIKEGSFASVMGGLVNTYIVPYAIILGLNNLHIGLLKAFSGLIPPISQIYGSKLMREKSRRKIIITFVALQAFLLLPVILLSLLFWKNLFTSYLNYFLIIFYTLYVVAGAIAGPAWFSLMGDIVPDSIRGGYFGKRNRITGAVSLIAVLGGAFILDFFRTKGWILIGFSILFLIASICRFISSYLFTKHKEHKLKLEKKYYFSFFEFARGFKKYNFTRFAYFVALMNFAVFLASPFFAVYMLSELKFNYLTYTLINISYSLAALIMFPIWGKFSDKYGRKEVLILSTVLISLMPVLWLFSDSPYFLAFPMILAGTGWAGFSLSSFNFIYDSVSVQRRGYCMAYYSILIGIGIFLGSTFGGLILHNLPETFRTLNKFFIIFLISALLRITAGMIFLPKIKEVRKVKKFYMRREVKHEFHTLEKTLGHRVHYMFR